MAHKARFFPWTIILGAGALIVGIVMISNAVNLNCVFNQCYSVKPLQVAQLDSERISGYFKMIDSASGIESQKYGGACVVFEDVGKTCEAASNCTIPSTIPASDRPFAYCADRKCWIKVKESHCWKSLASDPWIELVPNQTVPLPNVPPSDIAGKLLTEGSSRKVQARVVACLNGNFDKAAVKAETAKPPCGFGPGEVIEEFGKPTLVTL